MATLGGYLNSEQTAACRILPHPELTCLCRKGSDYHGRLANLGGYADGVRHVNQFGTLPYTMDLRLPSVLHQTNDVLLQVLTDAVERIIREADDPEPSAEVPLGLYLVRGDSVCSVGLVDEKLDESINWTEVRGSTIGGIKHI